MNTTYEELYDKYKNLNSVIGKIKFITLLRMKDSPYYNIEKSIKLSEELGKTEPVAYLNLFIENMIRRNYKEAFKYYKLSPLSPKFDGDYKIYFECMEKYKNVFKNEISYFYQKTKNCKLCNYKLCLDCSLNEYDIKKLNFMAASMLECPICYEFTFYNFTKCKQCKNMWCKECAKFINKCPFCRILIN
jgi:hypothetical protein